MYLECEDCYWAGESEELVSKTEDLNDKDYSFCPRCGGNHFEEYDEEDDENDITTKGGD